MTATLLYPLVQGYGHAQGGSEAVSGTLAWIESTGQGL